MKWLKNLFKSKKRKAAELQAILTKELEQKLALQRAELERQVEEARKKTPPVAKKSPTATTKKPTAPKKK